MNEKMNTVFFLLLMAVPPALISSQEASAVEIEVIHSEHPESIAILRSQSINLSYRTTDKTHYFHIYIDDNEVLPDTRYKGLECLRKDTEAVNVIELAGIPDSSLNITCNLAYPPITTLQTNLHVLPVKPEESVVAKAGDTVTLMVEVESALPPDFQSTWLHNGILLDDKRYQTDNKPVNGGTQFLLHIDDINMNDGKGKFSFLIYNKTEGINVYRNISAGLYRSLTVYTVSENITKTTRTLECKVQSETVLTDIHWLKWNDEASDWSELPIDDGCISETTDQSVVLRCPKNHTVDPSSLHCSWTAINKTYDVPFRKVESKDAEPASNTLYIGIGISIGVLAVVSVIVLAIVCNRRKQQRSLQNTANNSVTVSGHEAVELTNRPAADDPDKTTDKLL